MIYEKLHLKDYYSFLGDNGCDATVEIYLPYNMSEMKWDDKKRPCMIVCPGGGYFFCSQRESEPIALKLLPDGFNVFVLNYSVAPHRFPTQIREVAAVMELIHQNADKWNCDLSRVLISGFSAGGHLAAHYSTCYDCDAVREVFPNSKPVTASVLCYPVITADPNYAHLGSFDNISGKTDRTPEEIEFFSCDKQVKDTTPPAFIWHTASDNCVPAMNSLLYAKALSEHKIPVELHIYPLGDHGLSTADKQTHDNVNAPTARVGEWMGSLKKWFELMGYIDR